VAEYVVKIVLTSILVVAISETAKRSSLAGAILASLPLTSLIAFVWLYVDTEDTRRVASLATGIFWLVLPSLVLFVAFPVLLTRGAAFWPALAASIVLTVAAYFAMVWLLGRFGIEI
jgi:hypothetical protein